MANALAAQGYSRGDALALASGNSCEFMVSYYACAKLGVVCVPMNLGWRPEEIAYVLGHSQARGIVVEAQLVPLVEPAVAKVAAIRDVIVAYGTDGRYEPALPDRRWQEFGDLHGGDESEPEVFVDDRDAISYLYTSGTTSFPKGVVSSHTAIYLESLMVAAESGLGADERIAALMPLFHTAQLNGFGTPAVLMGATVVLMRGFDPDPLLELIERERISRIFALPMMYRALLEHPTIAERDFSHLRKAAYAMAPMPDELLKRCLDTFGCEFYLAFGQTEMSPVTTFFRPEHQLTHPGAVGTQVVNVQIAIMGPDGELLPRGTEGEIVYRGPQALSGYLKDPEATAAAFAHGWFHSGDVGRLEYGANTPADHNVGAPSKEGIAAGEIAGGGGMLWFSDRYKDVIKTGGENVASIEVEKAVYAADAHIAEAVVVELPHPRWSEAVTAVVVAQPGQTLDETGIIEAVRQRVGAYKAPKAVIVVDELPKTSTGKIQKNVVRTQHAGFYSAE
ncbi:MAG: AMP-binding protein [Jatrophihabitantaceae bacterium]